MTSQITTHRHQIVSSPRPRVTYGVPQLDGTAPSKVWLVEMLAYLLQEQDAVKLQKDYGGVEGLSRALHVDLNEGLSPSTAGDTSLESRQAAFGANRCLDVELRQLHCGTQSDERTFDGVGSDICWIL